MSDRTPGRWAYGLAEPLPEVGAGGEYWNSSSEPKSASSALLRTSSDSTSAAAPPTTSRNRSFLPSPLPSSWASPQPVLLRLALSHLLSRQLVVTNVRRSIELRAAHQSRSRTAPARWPSPQPHRTLPRLPPAAPRHRADRSSGSAAAARHPRGGRSRPPRLRVRWPRKPPADVRARPLGRLEHQQVGVPGQIDDRVVGPAVGAEGEPPTFLGRAGRSPRRGCSAGPRVKLTVNGPSSSSAGRARIRDSANPSVDLSLHAQASTRTCRSADRAPGGAHSAGRRGSSPP